MTLPDYYTRLGPFRELFRTGVPVVTYHHVGPRPPGARLKGLYLSPKLFTRQIEELRSATFLTSRFLEVLTATGSNSKERRVFLTFDDGFRDIFEHALPVLRQTHFQGIVFLVSGLLGKSNEWQQKAGDIVAPLMDVSQIWAWLAEGQEIGAHTQTHPRLTQLSLTDAREEISASKKSLEDRFGLRVDHFCYPYGDWNEAVRDLVISAGYRTACTTQAGVNTAGTSPFELRRLTARYASRNLRLVWRKLVGIISRE